MVYICSPFSGDMETNKKTTIEYCRFAMECGVTPVAPHLLFPQFLDDTIPAERELGMQMGRELMDSCSELWVMGDTVSSGMKAEIEYAKQNNIPVEYFTAEDMESTNNNMEVCL